MRHFGLWLKIILTATLAGISAGYKPIYIMHGLRANYTRTDRMVHRIHKAHPGTVIFQSNEYPGNLSMIPLWDQIRGDLGQEFLNFSKKYPDGFHLIGSSQGGLLCRGLIEYYPEHNVANFIAVASPLAGSYDEPEDVLTWGPNLPNSIGYKLMYDPFIQAHFSQANIYKDPKHYDMYLKYNVFLPYLDNEIPSNMSEKFKQGFTKIKKLVMIGGPDDGRLYPWQSSHFSYLNKDEKLVFFKDRRMYKGDWFGLRTLDEQGKLTVCIKSGVIHYDIPNNDTVIDECIIPYLD